MPSSHRAAIVCALLAGTARAFAPAPAGTRRVGGAAAAAHRVGGAPRYDRAASLLRASEQDGPVHDDSDKNATTTALSAEGHSHADDDDDDDEGDVDIIAQRLRRNADNGPINPVKEHDSMRKENEDEANVTVGTLNSSNSSTASSVLYSHVLAAAIDPDFDPDASADERYVEAQLQGLLSRKGEELARLGPGLAALPLDPASAEAAVEDALARREAALHAAAGEARAAAAGDWDEADLGAEGARQSAALDRAAALQADADRIHADDAGAVLLANLAFYEAFSLRDAAGMADAWWPGPGAVCVHPSRPPLVGGRAVAGSFAAMFAANARGGATAGAAAGAYLTPASVRGLTVRGTSASLVCDEEVRRRGTGVEGDASQRERPLVNKLLTTNMFRKIGGRWKMVHRHASWHPDTLAARAAMQAEPGLVGSEDVKDADDSSGAQRPPKRAKEGMTLQRLSDDNSDGSETSKRPVDLPPIPPSLEGLDINAALGIPVPKEEEPTKKKADGDAAGMVGKIINLSDLMGGLGDSTSSNGDEDEEKGIGDALADMLMGSAESDSTSMSGSGTPEDPFVTRRIIKIGPEDLKKHGQNQKKDDEEEPEVVLDLRGKSDEERKEALSLLAAGVSPSDLAAGAAALPAASDDALRRRCIATLRELAERGRLSPKQKRVLLTDIITQAARGETSMVEVAHELLLCDGAAAAEDDSGMEDFTEQCRVFAAIEED